jgi:hypothetical protein
MMKGNVLEKRLWTDADVERMEWHDATIHAVGFRPESFELLVDLDYIAGWVLPEGVATHYSFWVAPATLVFENVYNLHADFEATTDISIDRIGRSDVGTPRNAEFIGKPNDWLWTLHLHSGVISFRSTGFIQYFREEPRLRTSQRLSADERGGFSFNRHEADERRD